MNSARYFAAIVSTIAVMILFGGCKKEPANRWTGADSLRIVNESLQYRRDVENFFRNHPSSPFNTEPRIPFEGLQWYPPDANLYFLLKLQRYENPETVIIIGTKNEERTQLRYGFFRISIGGQDLDLNVYKFTEEDIRQHPTLEGNLSVWFTDSTTGYETYGVGRYVEIEPEAADPDHLYVINFNNAHNPYCAYNPNYSCAIPTKDDHLPVAIRAGEMNYHTGE